MTALFACLYVSRPSPLIFLDHQVYDIMLRNDNQKEPSDIPLVVDLDEKSLSRYGQWPWPRYRVAVLLARIKEAGASAIGLDILFSEPDRTSLGVIRKDLKKSLDIDLDFSHIPKAMMNNDEILANVLAKGDFTLGYYMDFGPGTMQDNLPSIPDVDPAVISTRDSPLLEKALINSEGAITPLEILAQSAGSAGYFNSIADRDGLLRRTPLLMTHKGKVYPCLAVATLLNALNNPDITVRMSEAGLESIRIGNRIIPVDEAGRMMIKYSGPKGTFRYVSAADVLEGKIRKGLLKNRIVFVGTSAAGLKDLRSTPFDPVYPGVEANVTILDNILRNDFISRPDWAPGCEFSILIFSGILFTLLFNFARARWVVPLAVAAVAGICTGSFELFVSAGIFVSPVSPVLLVAVLMGSLSLVKFFLEEKEKKFIYNRFSQYVSPKVVQKIANDPESFKLGGESRDVSILFTDIRGFTSISEKLTAAEVSLLLQKFFSPMTRIITENFGTLDKFIGDAIMAFWNAPLHTPNHRLQSAKTAVEMLITLNGLNRKFKEEFNVDVKIGAGLHSGQAQVGNMGSKERFDYTIIGDNVNLASRLEGLTKFYRLPLIVSADIAEACKNDFYVQQIDRIQVKGRQEPLTVYTLHTLDRWERYREEFLSYEEALHCYRNADFAEALKLFRELQVKFSRQHLYTVYHDRCLKMKESPPPADWQGIFTHLEK